MRRLSVALSLLFSTNLLSGCNAVGNSPTVLSSASPPSVASTPTSAAPATAAAIVNDLQAVSAVDVNNVPYAATSFAGALPTGGTGPAITLTNGSSSVSAVKGASALITLTTTQPATALLIGVAGVDGYYKAVLSNSDATPASDSRGAAVMYESKNRITVSNVRQIASTNGLNSYRLILDLPPALSLSSLNLSLLALYANEQVSPLTTSTLSIVAGGSSSNSFQANLSWRAPVDLDLHVLPPGGTEIGYNNRSSVGGTLDVDSNPACSIDNIDSENITWASGLAPGGSYVIRPNYFANCGITDPIPYTISVRTSSSVPATYVGSFQASEADANSGTDPSHIVTVTVAGSASPL